MTNKNVLIINNSTASTTSTNYFPNDENIVIDGRRFKSRGQCAYSSVFNCIKVAVELVNIRPSFTQSATITPIIFASPELRGSGAELDVFKDSSHSVRPHQGRSLHGRGDKHARRNPNKIL
jgi:hypothetical protein